MGDGTELTGADPNIRELARAINARLYADNARMLRALERIANINNGPDLASSAWRCEEAAEIARGAIKTGRDQ
jgi:hypothetical protein